MTRIVLAQLARLALCVGVILAAACGAGPNDVSGPTPTSPADSSSPSPSPSPTPGGASCTTPGITGTPSTVPDAGGHYMLSITAPSGCAWTARPDVTWAEVGPVAGQGNGAIELRISRNQVRDSRTVTVTVNGQSVRVVQEAARCAYTLDRTLWDVNWDTEPVSVRLTASMSDCSWTATSSESWVRPRTTSGTGNAEVALNIDRHIGLDPRRAVVTIGDQRLTVVQQPR